MHLCKHLPVVVLLLPAIAFADDDLRGAASLASGSVGVADPTHNQGITDNPAIIGVTEHYDIEGWGGLGGGGWVAGGSIIDSRMSRIAMGVGYQRLVNEPSLRDEDAPGWNDDGSHVSNVKRYHDIGLALAVPVWKRKLSFGINGVFSITNHDRQETDFRGNLDLGFAARPTSWLNIGLVGRNLIPLNGQPEFPMALAAGVRVGDEKFGSFEADVDYGIRKPIGFPLSIRAGIERPIRVVSIRAGWHYEGEERTHHVTGGIGVFNKRGALDFAFDLPTKDVRWQTTLIRLGLWIRT